MSQCPFSRVMGFFRKGGAPSSNYHNLLRSADTTPVTIDIRDPELMKQLHMIELAGDELRISKLVQPLISSHIDEIVGSFYATVLEVDKLKQLITEHSTVERLKGTLKRHLIEMFDGQIDSQFVEKRMRVAMIHSAIGLDSKWYLGAFQNLLNTLLGIIHREIPNREDSLTISRVITKILNFEQQIVLEAYERENMKLLELEYKKKESLVTRIIGTSADLASLTEETSASVDELVSSSSDVSRKVKSSFDSTRRTQQIAEEGEMRMTKLETSIASIDSSTTEMSHVVDQLNASAAQIRTVVNIVNEIAGQTHLLALNSAIESARAGEHGRGFEVVSTEVRKLSEQTKQSVDQIQTLIDQTITFSSDVAKAITAVQHVVQSGLKESGVTREAFNDIMTSMKANSAEIERVEADIKALVQVIEDIGEATQKVAASTESLNETARSV
ncbi:protoglobin domain-containing protein [Paenibacillus ferrarius]|uniref:protoglobin domain-containing protein n=1 Tax=Paenibacillus ferrarius TaxID=1469647 RepID=UPI003D2D3077